MTFTGMATAYSGEESTTSTGRMNGDLSPSIAASLDKNAVTPRIIIFGLAESLVLSCEQNTR